MMSETTIPSETRCSHGLSWRSCAACAVKFVPQPMGCICPPGANRDCENPLCPRKAVVRFDD